MELQLEKLDGNVTRAIPVGHWDVTGAAEIDLKLSAVANSGCGLIIDLAKVTYISSMGVRALILTGKAVKLKGGKMALLAPAPLVEEVLGAAAIRELFPVCRSFEEARKIVSAP